MEIKILKNEAFVMYYEKDPYYPTGLSPVLD